MNTPTPGSWLLIPFSNKRNQGFLEERLNPEQEIYKINLEYLIVPEHTEVLKNNTTTKTYIKRDISEGHSGHLKNFKWSKLEQFEQQNCNPYINMGL